MKRSDFLKSTLASLGLIFLPGVEIKSRKKILLLNFFVRGFQYYEGPVLINQMGKGNLLRLVREASNKADGNAIALYYEGKKIGFVPKEENRLFSKLIDERLLHLSAEIISINKKANSWEQVLIGLFASPIREEKLNASSRTLQD